MDGQQHLYDSINQVTHHYLETFDAATTVVRAIDSLTTDSMVIEATMNFLIETFGLEGFNSLIEDDSYKPKMDEIQTIIHRMEEEVVQNRKRQTAEEIEHSALPPEERLLRAIFGAPTKKEN